MRVRTPWPGRRQPPMLDIALDELPPRRAQDVLAGHLGPGDRERHDVLQLVAEAVGAARLIEGRARPDAAGERLIEQPAVQHDVHANGPASSPARVPSDFVPVVDDLAIDGVEIGQRDSARSAPAPQRHQSACAEQEDDLGHGAALELDRRLQGRARVEAGADPLRQRDAPALSAAGLSSVPLRPMNSLRSPVHAVWRPPRSAKATRVPNAACSTDCARASRRSRHRSR